MYRLVSVGAARGNGTRGRLMARLQALPAVLALPPPTPPTCIADLRNQAAVQLTALLRPPFDQESFVRNCVLDRLAAHGTQKYAKNTPDSKERVAELKAITEISELYERSGAAEGAPMKASVRDEATRWMQMAAKALAR